MTERDRDIAALRGIFEMMPEDMNLWPEQAADIAIEVLSALDAEREAAAAAAAEPKTGGVSNTPPVFSGLAYAQ